jgi:hypothetical protein
MPAPLSIRDLIQQTNLPRARVAAELGVTLRTLEHYARRDRAPRTARALLEILAGRLPWPGAERFRWCRGALYYRDNPDGMPIEEIPAALYRLRELECVRRELAQLRAAPAQYLLEL